MGKPTGFLEYRRQEVAHRPVDERTGDYLEVDLPLPDETLVRQAARCMDCGIPFCHGTGCPLCNRIPEFNDLIYRGRWRSACEVLHATNNFPEITGRVCPAPCEASCTLKINDQPVLIRHIERQIVERGFEEGWVRPLRAAKRTGRRVAIVGSGPAGLAAAQQLARAGHSVTVFEKDPCAGGLLRYGIPDFKLDKRILDRRLDQLTAEGVRFQTGVVVGEDVSVRYLRKTFDAVCLAMGAGRKAARAMKAYLGIRDSDAVYVPERRGIEGKIGVIRYVREQKIPFFGICLGMQCAAIEFARNVCGMENANSSEFDADTPHPVICLMDEQRRVVSMGGTMRLGAQ
ncbi:hypothetical protein LCGC14_2693810, partial [marine sediment metagenome]